MQIQLRYALMKQIWSHQRIIDKRQGSSKELGYQPKGDLSHMYRFLIRQIIEDIHPQRNIYIQDGAKEKKRTRYPKGSHKYTNAIVA